MSPTPLSYERKPPIGNSLIDSDPGVVFIRLLPDRKLGRGLSWFFAACGCCVLIFAIAQLVVTPITLLQSVPILFAGILFFVLSGALRYTPRSSCTMIQATVDGVEYSANEFAPRVIARTKIRRVFTRDAPFSRRASIGIRLTDGGEIVLGSGEAKEIEAMARALHRVLNSGLRD